MQQKEAFDKVLMDKDQELSVKDREIERLKAELKNRETEKELAISKAVREKDQEISKNIIEIEKLHGQLSNKERKVS